MPPNLNAIRRPNLTLTGHGTFIVDVDWRQAKVKVLLAEAALLRIHAVHKLFQQSKDIPPHPIN
jgi:hypothetical protein